MRLDREEAALEEAIDATEDMENNNNTETEAEDDDDEGTVAAETTG